MQQKGLLILGILAVLLILFLSGLRYLGSLSAPFEARVTSFEEPPAVAPLAGIRVTKVDGVATEISATLAAGARLDAIVNLSLFDGFQPNVSPEDARKLHGPPSGDWTDPYYGVKSVFYERPEGRVSLARGRSYWNAVGYPTSREHEYCFRNLQVLEQLLPLTPSTGEVGVNILREIGWGGVSVFLDRKECKRLILTARDER
jgi:hypothetical protein